MKSFIEGISLADNSRLQKITEMLINAHCSAKDAFSENIDEVTPSFKYGCKVEKYNAAKKALKKINEEIEEEYYKNCFEKAVHFIAIYKEYKDFIEEIECGGNKK